MTCPVRGMILGVLLVVLTSVPGAAWAAERIIVDVAGVSCPFCAFGLEKKLRALPGVEQVTLKINDGTAEIDMAAGHRVTEQQIRQAVTDAGFTPGEIRIEARDGSETERAP